MKACNLLVNPLRRHLCKAPFTHWPDSKTDGKSLTIANGSRQNGAKRSSLSRLEKTTIGLEKSQKAEDTPQQNKMPRAKSEPRRRSKRT